ncbi:HAMP domain-containing protein [bacterium]|nr:HAMP domain-containing protein [bacterium]
MLKFIKKHLFWKFFFSYFSLVLLSMLVMGVVVRITLPGLFNNHLVGMASIFSRYGVDTPGGMMGGRGMMGNSVLFTDLFDVFNQITVDAFLFAFLPSLLVALGLSVLMSRRFVQPLQQMSEAADRIAEGDYHERLPLGEKAPEEQDELQRFGARFNRMATQLEQVEDQRQKWIGNVAHELRTPLTVIKGSMEGLMDGVLEPDETTLARVYRQADRLERLVNDLQELNRLDEGVVEIHLRPVDLNRGLTEIVEMMTITFQKKDIGLMLELPEETLTARADEDRLQQVLINLLSNSLRCTPEGGCVTVSLGQAADEAQVTVQDTGIGIPAEHLPHVFERFYRVEDARSRRDGGSGLGLAIVSKLIEAQGGRIWAESAGTDQGAVFRFTLPLVD